MMIDPELQVVIRRQAALDLRERREILARELATLRESLGAQGLRRSSALQLQLLDAIRRECAIRPALVWQIMARALSNKAVSDRRALAIVLKEEIATLVHDGSEDLPGHYDAAIRVIEPAPNYPTLDETVESALERVYCEIDLAITFSDADRPGAEPSVVNIYQGFGVIQTGGASTARLTLSLDDTQRTALRQALDVVEHALEGVTSLAREEQAVVRELIDDLRRDTDRTSVNLPRLRSLLGGLATTIQTVGSLGPAYGVLKGAAALFGVPLP